MPRGLYAGRSARSPCGSEGAYLFYLEDHAHFAAFSGDLVPDNGAAEQVVEFCVVDDFYFFPYLAETQPPHEFYAEVLAVLQPEATRCKCAVEVRRFSLRAPPAA